MTKNYKQSYNGKNKIITFPLSNSFYDKLHKKSLYYDLGTNAYAKNIVVDFLNGKSCSLLSKDRQEAIQSYIRISRWIANNINQLAYQSNVWENIDIKVLINSLKKYESEFKKFLTR